ncbi:hypothetical protein [Streptomyces sp. STCH 565 A]|uniref:hypothetical protein n=1 Tax=Streptomyces sp. STCH 565 A TaxID=2950532 RepID=UPI00207576E5|nr:hypothetical protein [Streptomyces sp. STCH 565 A]MCM8555655.1 hypothetical protein [Streptomyces sp. STCH 565 A]
MPWVKLDDRFPSHRKIALLSDRAFRLHVSAICWCAENLTDGRISDRELALVTRVRGVKATAKQLEDAGLWDRADDGWLIHDYLDYNPSREQVLLERKKNAERQERFRRRKNGKPTPPSNGSSNGVTPNGEMRDGDTTATRRKHDGDTTATRSTSVRDEESQVNEIRNAVTNDAPTRPDPNPISMADVEERSTSRGVVERDALAPSPIDVDGFELTDSMRAWSLRTFGPNLDLDYETAQFIDHFRAQNTRRPNWPAEWQKWIRRSAKFASERANRPQLRAVSGGYEPYRNPTDQSVYDEDL